MTAVGLGDFLFAAPIDCRRDSLGKEPAPSRRGKPVNRPLRIVPISTIAPLSKACSGRSRLWQSGDILIGRLDTVCWPIGRFYGKLKGSLRTRGGRALAISIVARRTGHCASAVSIGRKPPFVIRLVQAAALAAIRRNNQQSRSANCSRWNSRARQPHGQGRRIFGKAPRHSCRCSSPVQASQRTSPAWEQE
jgi:hypothetical protein